MSPSPLRLSSRNDGYARGPPLISAHWAFSTLGSANMMRCNFHLQRALSAIGGSIPGQIGARETAALTIRCSALPFTTESAMENTILLVRKIRRSMARRKARHTELDRLTAQLKSKSAESVDRSRALLARTDDAVKKSN